MLELLVCFVQLLRQEKEVHGRLGANIYAEFDTVYDVPKLVHFSADLVQSGLHSGRSISNWIFRELLLQGDLHSYQTRVFVSRMEWLPYPCICTCAIMCAIFLCTDSMHVLCLHLYSAPCTPQSRGPYILALQLVAFFIMFFLNGLVTVPLYSICAITVRLCLTKKSTACRHTHNTYKRDPAFTAIWRCCAACGDVICALQMHHRTLGTDLHKHYHTVRHTLRDEIRIITQTLSQGAFCEIFWYIFSLASPELLCQGYYPKRSLKPKQKAKKRRRQRPFRQAQKPQYLATNLKKTRLRSNLPFCRRYTCAHSNLCHCDCQQFPVKRDYESSNYTCTQAC